MMSRLGWVRERRFALESAVFAIGFVAFSFGQGSPEALYATSRISQAEYQNAHSNLLYTHLGHNRGFGAQHDLARANIESRFSTSGLSTSQHWFPYSGNWYYNVVGELTGTTRPNDIYIVGAHFDSVNNPGADDNASGTAALMEMARLIGAWQSEATVRLIAFDREEQGLYGSEAYASDHNNENILGMISLDMIAYHAGGFHEAYIYGRTASNPIKNALAAALNTYSLVTPHIEGYIDASDHAPFEWEGFQACLLIEYDVWDNPWYHTSQDAVETPGNINYAFATAMTRGAFGWLVDAAGIIPPFPPGDMDGSYTVDNADIPAFVLALTDPDAYALLYPGMDAAVAGDVDGDGEFNNADIPAFVELLTG